MIARAFGFGLAAVVGSLVMAASATAQELTLHVWEKVRLTEDYFAEGASRGDFNRDGKRDLVCGPHWFAGPDFKTKHTFYPGKAFPNDRGYSDNFFSYVGDFNKDGWDDVLVIGLPGTPAHWYQNPKGEGDWKKHLAFPAVDNEAPSWGDLTGDGVPELLFHHEGRLGYASPNPESPEAEWKFRPIADKGPFQRFSHGLGFGDLNGDKRADFLMPSGWWEQPAEVKEGQVWQHHPYRFCPGGAQLHVVDVDLDGDADVVTSLNAHGYGMSWHEQVTAEQGKVAFKEHKFMGQKPEENAFGVQFSELHAIDCVDIDGDGRKDIVCGKTYWAHNGGDAGARDPAVVYWFRNTSGTAGVEFVPHLIDNNSGVGRQVEAVDMNGDGLVDIITGNKKGTFLFLHKAQKATKEEWEQAQPKRLAKE